MIAVRNAQASANLATKEDLAHLEIMFRTVLEKMETRLDAKHEALRKDVANMEERLDVKHEASHLFTEEELAKLNTLFQTVLEKMETRLDAKHEALRKDMHHELKQLESRTVIKLGSIVAAGVAVLGMVVPLTLKLLHVF